LADVWLQINRGENVTLDLGAVDPALIPSGSLSHIDISGNGGHGDTVIVSAHDVEKLGAMDLVVNTQTGLGHIQMLINGDANDTVQLAGGQGQWADGGTTQVDGQSYQILNHDNLQLLVGVKIQETIG
jgi:hypothetical protein